MTQSPGKHLNVAQAIDAVPADRRPAFVELFQHGTLSVEMYAPRGQDEQQPHDRDEVYVIAAGRGTFRCGDVVTAFATGDFLFVPAHVPHRFETFTSDFATWVFFYGPSGGERRA